MKIHHVSGLVLLAFIISVPSWGMGQSRCVILEKQGNRALVSCNGGQTRFIDLRGKTDVYKVGDSVDASDITTESPKERPSRQK